MNDQPQLPPSQPSTADAKLRTELLTRAATDQQVRTEVIQRWPGGSLIDTDDPLYLRWRRVDRDNTAWLRDILDATGWPTIDRVGDGGAQAAWLLAQHADDHPEFQRRCLHDMTEQTERGQASRALLAYLVDRVAIHDGRPQTYGTQHHWCDGVATPLPIHDPDRVDQRRADVGLPPLAESTADLHRDEGDPEHHDPPSPLPAGGPAPSGTRLAGNVGPGGYGRQLHRSGTTSPPHTRSSPMTSAVETLRDRIRAVVAAIEPWDPVEADAQASVLRWIDSGAELFRHAGASPPRHLAVYFALLDDTTQSILQIHHVKAGTWLLPGGHVDTELPERTVLREVEEELGLRPAFHPLTGPAPLFVTESQTNGLDSHTDVTLWYLLAGHQATPVTADPGEISDVRWVRLADAARWAPQCHAAHQVLRFAAKLTATSHCAGSALNGGNP